MGQLLRSTLMRRLAGALAIGIMVLIAVLSLLPAADLPGIEGSDKVKHFIAYAGLAGPLAIWAGPGRALRVFLVAALFGLAMECAQYLAPTGRDFSLLDEGANICGAGLGTLIAVALRR